MFQQQLIHWVLTNITRDYTVTPVFEGLPGKGNLKVTLLGTQNGRWRLAGEKVWRKSGVTLLDIPGGEHTIECKPVKGFHTPERELVLVNNKQTNYTVVEYIALLAKPKVHYFTATPDIVEPGGVVTLEWEVKGAENCKIVGINNHFLDKKGSELVRVSAKTNFELRASNEDGSSNATTSVDTASDLEILEFGCSHADGKPLYPGNVARLCWVAKGADKAILKNLNTGKTLIVDNIQGYLDVNPEETTEYSLSVTNTLIGEEKHLTLVVSDETYISSFSSNCENIFQGNKAKLSWEVQGIDAVEIIPGIGYVDPVGSVEVAISENSSFTLKAGNVEKSLSILAINEAPDLEVSLSEIKDQTGKKLKRSTIGQGVSVLAKVENRGSVSCSNLLIRLKNQNRIIDEVVVDSLASGESKTLTFNWIPRWNGRHKLELIADPENKVSEIQEGNNRAGKKIRVAGIGGIDLAIDDLKVEPGDDPAGRILKVSYSVYNLGTEESESFQYQVYLTKGSKQKLNKALALVADDHVDSLAPGESLGDQNY